jgi:hypothetical protein
MIPLTSGEKQELEKEKNKRILETKEVEKQKQTQDNNTLTPPVPSTLISSNILI